ncbi:GSCOCG00011068001-RA-CDS [Cotesia congregata]|uniref:Similar to atpsckmt: ATP synthase subunit C lysine N-methyltransferase (Xenopus laevis) n=1 Tax=Cotesia congregata TaxID=51543 RepID=A0A8J2MN85_COTCN|nr:GSCOCG00011068001-RA-CDS [Cotesia congregata]CAG5084812.1 Similar to atpsckmt: ATP synthase subunit C lysine N-methyltransferase (Xenopus laevis) [Cotesia congregata]
MEELLEVQNNNITNQISRPTSKAGLVLIGITGGIGLGLTVISIPFVSPALRKICLPYVPATNQQLKNVLLALRGRSGTVIDLGSGDGRLVLAAAKNNFNAYGVELNFWLVTYSKLLAYSQGLSSKAVFYRENLWNLNLSKYDNVVLFGVQSMMQEIESKFIAELKKDCTIVVCRFPLPNLVPVKTIGHGVDRVWVYKPL